MELALCMRSAEMIRARTLCAKANAVLPDDPGYMKYLEELFGRSTLGEFAPAFAHYNDDVLFGENSIVDDCNSLLMFFVPGLFYNSKSTLSQEVFTKFPHSIKKAQNLLVFPEALRAFFRCQNRSSILSR